MRASRRPQSSRQRSLAWVKLALATVGVGTFLLGIYYDDMRVRWIGTGLVAVAFVIRFFGRNPRDSRDSD